MNSSFPATISLPSPRRGRRPGKNKRRNSGNNIATSERVEMTPSLPSVQESNAEVAKLREHLAWTRESYNESLKELQETQAICVADRMELEHLRSVLKDHLVEEKAKAEKERGGYKIGYDSEAEEEYSSPKETKEPAPLPLEKWYQDLQGLIKDKADGELRLKGMANQLRDIKYLMKQVQDENKDLKKQIANLQDGSHETIKNNSIIMNASMGEGSEHKEEHPFSASIQELQQEVNKWEALYFESAEMGAKTIERLEDTVAKIREENGKLEYERNEAIQALAMERAIRAATVNRGTQYLSYEEIAEEEKKQEDGEKETTNSLPQGDPNGIDSSLSTSVDDARKAPQEDELMWMERLENMDKVVRQKDHAIAELHQQLHHMTREKLQYQAQIKHQQAYLQKQQTAIQKATSVAEGDELSISIIRKDHEKTFSIPTLTIFDLEQTARSAVMDVFCCGNHAQVAPDTGSAKTTRRD